MREVSDDLDRFANRIDNQQHDSNICEVADFAHDGLRGINETPPLRFGNQRICITCLPPTLNFSYTEFPTIGRAAKYIKLSKKAPIISGQYCVP